MVPGISFDIISGMFSWHTLFDIYSDKSFHFPPGSVSGILSDIFWNSIWHFYFAGHFIWQSVWVRRAPQSSRARGTVRVRRAPNSNKPATKTLDMTCWRGSWRGGREGGKEGRRQEGRGKEGSEGRKETRKGGKQERRNEGRNEGSKEAMKEGRKEARETCCENLETVIWQLWKNLVWV